MLSDSPGLCGALHVGSTVVGMDDRGWRGQSRCHRASQRRLVQTHEVGSVDTPPTDTLRPRKGRSVQTHEVGRRSTSHFCANPHLLAPRRPERGGWHKHTRLAGRNRRGRHPCIHATPPSERTHQPEPPLGPCSRCVIPRSEQRLHRSSGSAPRLSTTCCRAGTA